MSTDRKEQIEVLDARLRALKRTWDLYVRGDERFPPVDEQQKLDKDIRKLRAAATRWSTADRFKLGAIAQRFSTYGRMWDRTLREIEEGRHLRDRFNKRRKKAAEAQEERAPKSQVHTLEPLPAEDLDMSDFSSPAPRAPASAAPRPQRARPRAASADAYSDEKMKRLYAVYMKARKRTGDSTAVNYDSLARKVRSQIPALKKKHNAKNIDFKVVLKNGKAILKAVPK